MLAGSFRLVTARLIPRQFRCKQALLLALLILAGCGGSSEPKATTAWQPVRGASFRFQVPEAWKVVASPMGAKASSDGDLVQVATFPLVKRYVPALFTRVESELAARMGAVAKQTGGTVTDHRVVTADGLKAHSYDVRVGDRTDTYTFVLRGKREYQLLCSADADVCARLLTSFAAD
jgi:hypothetical protein